MSWYDTVKSIMDSYGVPEQVWVGAATAESSLNLHPKPGDNGMSYGLFQINTAAHTQFKGMSKAQLEDPTFQAKFMAPQFASSWRDAQNKGLTGASAYNYAAWAAERPYGFPNQWGLESYSKKTGITGGEVKVTGGTVGMGDVKQSETSTGVPVGNTNGSTGERTWLEEKVGLSPSWETNLVIGVIGLIILAFALYGLVKQEV